MAQLQRDTRTRGRVAEHRREGGESPYDPTLSEALAAVGYDADRAPEAAVWLAHEEVLRTEAIAYYHDVHRPHPLPESLRLHSICHAIVEDQLAQGHAEARATLERLMGEGLSRHDAIHAIGTIALGMVYDAIGQKQVDNEGYVAALAALTKESWLEMVGPPKHPARRGRRER